MTRPRIFADNEAHLQLHALAYNLENFLHLWVRPLDRPPSPVGNNQCGKQEQCIRKPIRPSWYSPRLARDMLRASQRSALNNRAPTG